MTTTSHIVSRAEAAEAIRLMSQTRTALAAQIEAYWHVVLGFESTVGLTDAESRQALHHCAMALNALQEPVAPIEVPVPERFGSVLADLAGVAS
jgi:hypothetical protein